MALSDKDREYINKIRRGLENKEKRNIGFNTIAKFGQDAGYKVFDDMVESDEVANENPIAEDDNNMPTADIFDDDSPINTAPVKRFDDKYDNNVRKFDNTTSIAQDAGTEYDEDLLGFDANDDIFNDTNAPLVGSATPSFNQAPRNDKPANNADIESTDSIGTGVQEDDLVKAGDLVDALNKVVSDYGRLPVAVISIDGSDIPITSIDIDDNHSVIRIVGTLDSDD